MAKTTVFHELRHCQTFGAATGYLAADLVLTEITSTVSLMLDFSARLAARGGLGWNPPVAGGPCIRPGLSVGTVRGVARCFGRVVEPQLPRLRAGQGIVMARLGFLVDNSFSPSKRGVCTGHVIATDTCLEYVP